MVINFFGMGYTKLQLSETVVAFNPTSKEYDPKAPKFGADVVMVSLNDAAFNGSDQATFGSKEPFVIDSPGEYEIGGTIVRGLPSPGPSGMINTIYTMIFDGIRVCHLGGLASAEITPEVVEEIGVVDLLFVPVGGGPVMEAKPAAKVCTLLAPKLIIPTCYSGPAELKKFLQECGEDKVETVDKLAIKRKDLDGKEGEIIIIKS